MTEKRVPEALKHWYDIYDVAETAPDSVDEGFFVALIEYLGTLEARVEKLETFARETQERMLGHDAFISTELRFRSLLNNE